MSKHDGEGTRQVDELGLINKAREGDREAFAQLLYKSRLFAFALSKTQNGEDAEELVQETFTKFWKALPEYEVNASLANFLYIILTNTFNDRGRKKGMAKKHADRFRSTYETTMHSQPPVQPDSQVIHHEQIGKVKAKVETLDERDQTIFRLYFIDELPLKEIAEQMKIDMQTVKNRLFRMRHFLFKKKNIEG